MDLIAFVLIYLLFGLSFLYIQGCDRLKGPRS